MRKFLSFCALGLMTSAISACGGPSKLPTVVRAAEERSLILAHGQMHAAATPSSVCGVASKIISCNPTIQKTSTLAGVGTAARRGQFTWTNGGGDAADFSTEAEIADLDQTAEEQPNSFWIAMWFSAINRYVATHAVAYNGNPADGQTCAASKPVGDFLGMYNNGSGQQSMYAQEVNVVFGDPKFTVTNPSSYATSGVVLAWVYKDQNGHYWIQPNPAIQSQITAGVSAWYASVGITFPANGNVTYVGAAPPKLPSAETYATCWPQAPGGLFPG